MSISLDYCYRKVQKWWPSLLSDLASFSYCYFWKVASFRKLLLLVAKMHIVHGLYEATIIMKTSTLFIWRKLFHVIAFEKRYSKEYCLITVWVSTHKRKTFWNKEKVMYLSELHKETSKFVMTVKKCTLDQVGKACCNYNFRDF